MLNRGQAIIWANHEPHSLTHISIIRPQWFNFVGLRWKLQSYKEGSSVMTQFPPKYSQQTPHSSPVRVSYGVSVVNLKVHLICCHKHSLYCTKLYNESSQYIFIVCRDYCPRVINLSNSFHHDNVVALNSWQTSVHWNGNVVISMKFLSLASLEVGIFTTSGADSYENLIRTTTFLFLCVCFGDNICCS